MSDTESSDSDVEDLMYLLDEIEMEIQGNILVKGVDKPHVVIPEGVEIIGRKAFRECTNITSVVFPSTLTRIGDDAFYKCNGLTSVTFPEGLTSIGKAAFYKCTGLTSVVLPEGLISIESQAFSSCMKLTSVVFPSTLSHIGVYAFFHCISLTSLTLPEGLSRIENRAFFYCTRLTSVSFPSTLSTIGESAFQACISLASVVLPEYLTDIESGAFFECTRLTSVVFPHRLYSIGDDAFYKCTGLISLSLPEGLSSIGYGAFTGCSGLTSVELPNSFTSIGERAFYQCTNLRILVPQCTVYADAFEGCALVLNASGRNIPGSVIVNPRIISLRKRLLALWSQNVRRQGRMRQSGKNYKILLSVGMMDYEQKQSKRERPEVLQIWREIKQILDPILMWFKTPMERTDALNVLFRKIIAGGRRLVKMKSYLNQPEETKVFKKVLEDLGIREPRRFRNWGGRLESRLRF